MLSGDKSVACAPTSGDGGVSAAVTAGAVEPKGWWSIPVAVACVIATVFGIYRLLGPGPFDWHAEQPEFIDGMIWFAALWAASLLFLVVLSGWVRLLCVGVLLALYMRLHGTDLALLLGLAYCIGIYGLGAWFVPADSDPDQRSAYLYRVHALRGALGLSLMALFLMLGALLFEWNFEANRNAGLAMAAIGLVLLWFRKHGSIRSMPDPLRGIDWAGKAALSLLLATAAVGIARSNLPFYFDSAWYGLRPDRVLIGASGFYEHLGLTTQVHYYPKLYELVLAPLQGMGDASNAVVVGVMGACLLVLAIVSLTSVFGFPIRYGLVHATLVVCYPAVMGTVETPKGDILAAAFVLFAFVALCRALEARSPKLLVDVAVFCLLASTIRLTALPWLAVLFVGWVFAMCFLALARGRQAWSFRWLLLLLPVFAVFVLTHARTYWLTGVPVITNNDLQAHLAGLGFELRAPIGALTGSGGARVGFPGGLGMLADVGLRPDRLPLHVFKWIGAAWIVYLTVTILRPDRAFGGWRGAVSLLGIALFPLLIAFNSWASGAPGGDGNYFIVSVAMIYVCGIAAIRVFHPLALVLLLLCGGAGTGMYILSANWEIGTGPVSRTLDKSPFDEADQVKAYLDRQRLGGVAERLRACGREIHMIGELSTPGAYLLPVRFEPFEEMAWNNADAFEDEGSLLELLQGSGTDLVVLPAPRTVVPQKRAEMVEFVRARLEHNGTVGAMARVRFDGIDLYATSSAGADCIRSIATRGLAP